MKTRRNGLIALAGALALTLGVRGVQAGEGDHHKAAALPNCPLMDEPIDLGVSLATDDGPVFFCCEGCIPKYKANPAKYAAKVAAQRKALTDRAKIQVTCPVMKEALDPKTMVSIEHEGGKVTFCCKGCVKKFKANPGKYQAALANSFTYQTKCPVMGETINPSSFAKADNGQTFYFCCKGCDKKFFASPAKYASKMASQGILINPAKLKPAGHGGDGSHGHGHGHGHGHDHGHGDGR